MSGIVCRFCVNRRFIWIIFCMVCMDLYGMFVLLYRMVELYYNILDIEMKFKLIIIF